MPAPPCCAALFCRKGGGGPPFCGKGAGGSHYARAESQNQSRACPDGMRRSRGKQASAEAKRAALLNPRRSLPAPTPAPAPAQWRPGGAAKQAGEADRRAVARGGWWQNLGCIPARPRKTPHESFSRGIHECPAAPIRICVFGLVTSSSGLWAVLLSGPPLPFVWARPGV